MLEAKDVSYRYGADSRVLRDVTLRVADGERLALLGPSGRGKSTLALLLAGYLPLQQGTITLDGAPLPKDCYNPVQLIYQHPEKAMDPRWKVGDTLREAWDVPEELLTAIGAEPNWLTRWPHELSGGMLQRVLCAMADVGEPEWILADEPSKGLDPVVRQMVADNLKFLAARADASLLLITHDIPLARQLAAYVVVMQEGRIVEQGTNVWEHPSHPYTLAYFAAQPELLAAKKNADTVPVRVGEPSAAALHTSAVLTAEGVTKFMRDRATGKMMRILDGCTLSVAEGRAVGLEGKSGAGKSTLVRALLGLIRPDGGTVQWNGRDLCTLSRADMRSFRRHVQLVAQNPEQAFDPRLTIAASLAEVFAIHPALCAEGRTVRERIADGLAAVELTERVLARQPHELSGGELQRAAIARALSTEPQILLLDEPTTMLDVSIQAQIMELLMRLREERQLGMLLISHDRPLLRYFADEIYVLEAGKVR